MQVADRHGHSGVAFLLQAVFIYSDLPCSKLSLFEELSQSIIRSLSLTVILAVWVYMVPHISEWHMSRNRCWEIFLKRCMPVRCVKGIVYDFLFKVSFHWFSFLYHIPGMLISCGCVGRGECDLSSVSTKTLCSVRDPLCAKLRFCMNYTVFEMRYISHFVLFTLACCMRVTKRDHKCCHSFGPDSSTCPPNPRVQVEICCYFLCSIEIPLHSMYRYVAHEHLCLSMRRLMND